MNLIEIIIKYMISLRICNIFMYLCLLFYIIQNGDVKIQINYNDFHNYITIIAQL